MCGIFFLNAEGLSEAQKRDAVEVHAENIRARGPDQSATKRVGDHHVLVFHRLAIIATGQDDVGMQPIEVGRSISFVCNGEIYNHEALSSKYDSDYNYHHAPPPQHRRSDVDPVARMMVSQTDGSFLEQSVMLRRVSEIDGDFALVATDGETVVAARDRYGVRPLFYGMADNDRIIAFASEAKALLGLPGVSKVCVFPPGHLFYAQRFAAFEAHVHPTWCDLESQMSEQVRVLLYDAVSKRLLHSERPVGLLCSGGVDSSVIVAIAARVLSAQQIRETRVFTMKYGNGHSDDAFYARLLCERLGFKHEIVEFMPEQFDEAHEAAVRVCETPDPNTVRAAIPMLLMARHIAATTDIKVLLSGEGADELFGGYAYFKLAPTPEHAKQECERLLRNLHMFDVLRADRCFAACGLEVRVPFLDVNLVSCVNHERNQSVEGLRGIYRGAEKSVLRDAFRAIYPELRDCRILDRPKEKFSDGTGFSYVPDLLRHLVAASGKDDDGTLASRLVCEKAASRDAFSRQFGSDNMTRWVIERTMPQWVTSASAEGSDVSFVI